MNELKVFEYENNAVRTTLKNGEIWWVAKDICDIFGETNRNRAMQLLSNDEKGYTQMNTPGGTQKITIINEAGLYSLLFAMTPSKARGVSDEYIKNRQDKLAKFKRWVTHEVLPSIRKHGAYITSDKMEELMNDPDTWVKLIRTLQQERREKTMLQNQIDQDRPKVIFADAVATADTDILVGVLAKILKSNGVNIGQNRLFERLRQDGFLVRRNGRDYNLPTQKAMDLGLFKVKETAVAHSDGHVTVIKTAKVTGKGQQYFVNYFLKKDGVQLQEDQEKPFLNTFKNNGGK